MQETINPYRVVFHLSSDDVQVHKALLSNINNALKAFDKLEVEVVTHGLGIEFLQNTSVVKDNIEKLSQKDVVFLVCKNTLVAKEIDSSSILSFAKIVPSGIAHIIQRQTEGWSYIKAGF